MGTERLHAVDDAFNGESSEHDTNPGSQRALAKKIDAVADVMRRVDQRSIDTQDMVRGLAGEVGKMRSDFRKRIPPYAVWVIVTCAVLLTAAALWSVFGRGGA